MGEGGVDGEVFATGVWERVRALDEEVRKKLDEVAPEKLVWGVLRNPRSNNDPLAGWLVEGVRDTKEARRKLAHGGVEGAGLVVDEHRATWLSEKAESTREEGRQGGDVGVAVGKGQ